MGREVRRVPPNWEHPRWQENEVTGEQRQRGFVGQYRPCFDEDYDTAATEWLRECALWAQGEHPDQAQYEGAAKSKYYWEWAGLPPEREGHRPAFTEEPTWHQLYETVSEGTPVSPPFATLEELARYLSEEGDFWYQNERREGSRFGGTPWRTKPTYEQALSLVTSGGAPTFLGIPGKGLFDAYQQQTVGAEGNDRT